MSNTPKLSLPEISASQSSKEVTHNEALMILDALCQPVAEDITATPPGTPSDGNVFIVDSAATGAWSGHDYDVAQYDSTAWDFLTPRRGWRFFVNSQDADYFCTGSFWYVASYFSPQNEKVGMYQSINVTEVFSVSIT